MIEKEEGKKRIHHDYDEVKLKFFLTAIFILTDLAAILYSFPKKNINLKLFQYL
jgi:hypothetical protein